MNGSRITKPGMAVLLLAVITVAGASAQAMKGMSGMGPKSGHGGPSASMPMGRQMDNDFPVLWREALAKLALTPEQTRTVVTILKNAKTKLSENWAGYRDAVNREAAAGGDAKKTAGRRVDLAHSERDLIISGVETELMAFLPRDRTDVIVSAAFHGVSKAHTGDMPMGDVHGMNDLQEVSMRLMDMAGMMNADFQALTIDTVIRELEAK